jgi:superfamily I DNA/RNA helicase
VADRLGAAASADWVNIDKDGAVQLKALAGALARAAGAAAVQRDPLKSRLTMGAIYHEVSHAYAAARERMPARARSQFDEQFQHWLFWVYDPLSAVAAYFGGRESEAAHRMRRGTAARVNEAEILKQATADWSERVYGPEDRPWLAWLLRFALPEATDSQARFREMPSSIVPATTEGERWTHVAIDEAQDLCVAEASLLGSLVDPDGALTVSADFRQIVSPVHGMGTADALSVGRSLRGKGVEQIYPFARNMRQSQQIGRFLQGFYEAAFRERPTFDVNLGLEDKKPQLIIAPPQDHALRIKQIASVLRRSDVVNSIALLQINEDEQALRKLRAELEKAGVPLAPAWAAAGPGLLTTSVERIKGLEFDACLVLGLEDVETAALNFTLNRAYIALSRPTRRLALICSEYPPLLRKVDKSLFDVTQS